MSKQFKKHVIVVGSARSGTSWLAELLARPSRYRLLFEPEHEFQTSQGKWLSDQWIQKDSYTQNQIQYLKKVFANRVDNDWIAQHSNRKYKRHLWPFIAKKYIIKFVRCNLSAPFYLEYFGIPVIHLIRNPYAVIASQERVQFPWLYNLSHFQQQAPLVNQIKAQFNIDISQLDTYSKRGLLALRWCIENVFILQKKELPENYFLIRYDEITKDPNQFIQLCNSIGFQHVNHLTDWYQRPSSKTHPKSAIITQKTTPNNISVDPLVHELFDAFQIKTHFDL